MKVTVKILSVLMILCVLLSGTSVFGVSADTTEDAVYRSRFLEEIDPDNVYNHEEDLFCEILYKYYANPASDDEATPDFVMAECFVNPVTEVLITDYIGEYVIVTGPCRPYIHGYHIYVPSEDKVYTLEEAYYANVNGIEDAIMTLDFVMAMVGDCDGNYKVNIKDATCVQKRIAGLEVPEIKFVRDYISFVYDFNRDEDVNIKDATAIQKYLAGITE